MKPSQNTYDWLGNGMYFWENNYARALLWAEECNKEDPHVIGAVIDLGHCLNLTDSENVDILKAGYNLLQEKCTIAGKPMPKNKPHPKFKGESAKELLIRDLDCAVIQTIHDFNKSDEQREYDSVRGVFVEGSPIYDGSGFCEKTHIQICVVNPNCIKGFFIPRIYNDNHLLP